MNIQATIRDLEIQRMQIDRAIASLRALGTNGNGARMAQVSRPAPTIIGAAVAHLKATKGTQTTRQVLDAIRLAGVTATPGSIRTVLSKRSRAKVDLVKRGRALWGLKK